MTTWLTNRPAWLAWLLIALPICLFAGIALYFVENVPWFDDIEMFVMFIQDYYRSADVSEKVFWLLKPNNEHRILFAKLAALFTYLTTGTMNFRGMILIGNLVLLLMLGVLFAVFRSMRVSIWAFVPVPFMLLHPQYFMTTSWGIPSLQHPVVLFFLCAVMFLLSRGSRNQFLLAVPLQIFASMSMSTALFTWLSGGLVLWRQGHYRRLAIWTVTALVTIVLYFQGFTSAQGHDQSLDYLLHKPHMVVIGALSFIGGSFDWLPTLPLLWRGLLPTLGGLLMVLIFLWLINQMTWPFRRSFGRVNNPTSRAINDNFFLGCYGTLFINASAVGLLRMRYGYDVMLVSNYMIYPALLLCLLYLNGLQTLPRGQRPTWKRIGTGLSLLIWMLSYFWHLPEMAFRNQYIRAAVYNQEHNGIGLGGISGTPLAGYIQQALAGAVRGGFYAYPPSPIVDFTPISTPIAATVKRGSELYTLEGDGLQQPIYRAFAVLQSDTHMYLVASKTPYRLAAFWLRRPSLGVQAELRASDLRPGTYRLGWTRQTSAGQTIQFSDQTIVAN